MRLLYITKSPPRPLNIGGNQRTHFLYRALARVAEVDLFLAIDPADLSGRQNEEIQREFNLVGCAAPKKAADSIPWRFLSAFWASGAERLAAVFSNKRQEYVPNTQWASAVSRLLEQRRYDAVVVKSLALARKAGLPAHFPVILDVDDTEYEWFESQVAAPTSGWIRRVLAQWRLKSLRNVLPRLYSEYSYKWVTKQNDCTFPGLENARMLGVPVFIPDGGAPVVAPDSADRRTILMVGSYYHRPNREGLEWFLRSVWPTLNIARPLCRLRIVGPGLSREWLARRKVQNVEYVGPVPNLTVEYDQAAFTIAPIWSGAGINVKVFESYLYGRVCVATPFAARGCEQCLVETGAIAVADDPQTFTETCARLLDSPAARRAMVERGRPKVLEHFSFERFAAVVEETVAEIARVRGGMS